MTPAKGAVTSQDKFCRRQIKQYWITNCKARLWRSIIKQWTSLWTFNKRVVPSNRSNCILPFLGEWEQKLLEVSWIAFPEKKDAWWHYEVNHSVTIFAENWKGLSKNVMLKFILETIRKSTKEDGCCSLKRFSFMQDFTVWSERDCSLFDEVGLARH